VTASDTGMTALTEGITVWFIISASVASTASDGSRAYHGKVRLRELPAWFHGNGMLFMLGGGPWTVVTALNKGITAWLIISASVVGRGQRLKSRLA